MDDDENDVISAALTSCFDGAEKIAEHWQAFDMISLREGLDRQAEEIGQFCILIHGFLKSLIILVFSFSL